ncbi:MAG: gliding motility-associated C-terminal domain-containing protein [Bacteroidia bacterium]|nr:gliding motility-associated C-terminal domain-containing protein [Bacteroidia bacterium]
MKKIAFVIGWFISFSLQAAETEMNGFIENKGQWASHILFELDIPAGRVFIERNQFTYVFYDSKQLHEMKHGEIPDSMLHMHAVKVSLKGANPLIKTEKEQPLSFYRNYFKGQNPLQWQSFVSTFQKITLADVYLGINLEFLYSEGKLKYNFIVKPGADASLIQLSYQGQENLFLSSGSLIVKTSLQQIAENKPVAFYAGDSKRALDCEFVQKGNIVSFKTEPTDASQTLIIDPEVIFATFSGSTADNWGCSATNDQYGNAYSGGTVFDVGYPSTTGAYQVNFGGYIDVGILKYTPSGTGLLYATYLGGSSSEQTHSLIVNSKNQLVLLGTTQSNDFPVTAGSYDPTHNGSYDIVVGLLSENGASLLGSTYFGSDGSDGMNGPANGSYNAVNSPLFYNYGDNYRGEVIVDKNDNIHLYISSRSVTFTALATAGGLVTYNRTGPQYAVYARFTPDITRLDKVRFLGGTGQVSGFSLTLDQSQQYVYLCGGTTAADVFPAITSGYQPAHNGNVDGYIARLSTNISASVSEFTYLGGTQYDQTYFVQTDAGGRVYVTGQTLSDEFPVSPGTIAKTKGRIFFTALSSDLSSVIVSTVIGNGLGRAEISPSAFLVDRCGNVCLSGWGGRVNNNFNSGTGRTTGLAVTSNGYQQATDGSDFYLAIITSNLDKLVYGSFFGGPVSEEHVDGGTSRFDQKGIVYQSVCGGCGGNSDFPTTPGAWSRTNKSFNCNNATFKINLNNSLFAPQFKDTFLTVYATETLTYNFQITDPDKDDSLYVTYSGTALANASTNNNPAVITGPDKGLRPLSNTLTWKTNCTNGGKDTLWIRVDIHDNGCPDEKSKTGYIRILVKPVPDVIPPELTCVKSLDSNTVKVIWSADKSNPLKFFKEVVMNKVLPDLNVVAPYQTYLINSDDSLVDPFAYYHKQNDYCYYMYGVNICNKHSDTTRYSCTKLYPDTANYNPFDMAMDTILYAIATDSFYYDFSIKSKVPKKLTIQYEYHGEILADNLKSANVGTLDATPGIDIAKGHIAWKAECADIGKDTFTISMLIWDNACPVPNSRTNRIHIVVVPPPAPKPPVMYCVKRIDANTLRVRWDFDSTDKYFSHFILYRQNPDGSTQTLQQYYRTDTLSYTDTKALNWLTKNYCYYFIGYNNCGYKGPSSLRSCSIIDSTFVPPPLSLNYVSVENNKEIEVNWKKSTDPVWEKYQLYRRLNFTGAPFESFQTITKNDTSLLDPLVDVSNISYCYSITQYNECGLESKKSDEACTIVLRGVAKQFENQIYWDAYTSWKTGVSNYRVFRTDPFIPETKIAQKPGNELKLTDAMLYDDCGLYFYRVVAVQNSKGKPFESSSNTIALVQQPLVFAPTAFTPNGDALNDYWGVVPSFVKEFNILIYNRWGQQVFQSNDKKFLFNGTFGDNMPRDEIFAYVIRFTDWSDKPYELSGSFHALH